MTTEQKTKTEKLYRVRVTSTRTVDRIVDVLAGSEEKAVQDAPLVAVPPRFCQTKNETKAEVLEAVEISQPVAGENGSAVNSSNGVDWTYGGYGSRYHLAGLRPKEQVIVGWDRPLGTFYAQVWAPGEKGQQDDGGTLVKWLGTAVVEVPTLEDLVAKLDGHATISIFLQARLEADASSTGDYRNRTLNDTRRGSMSRSIFCDACTRISLANCGDDCCSYVRGRALDDYLCDLCNRALPKHSECVAMAVYERPEDYRPWEADFLAGGQLVRSED